MARVEYQHKFKEFLLHFSFETFEQSRREAFIMAATQKFEKKTFINFFT
jgi:hypothetical protein